MILNVADLKKLIQDLNEDTIVQIYDGNDDYVIADASVTHDEETDKYHMLYLWVRKLTDREKKMRVIRLSTPANDAAFDALVSAQRYMSDFVPVTMEENREAKQVLKSIKKLLKEVHNREEGSNE